MRMEGGAVKEITKTLLVVERDQEQKILVINLEEAEAGATPDGW